MKVWHPEAWKPLNIKPVVVSELPNENICEEHSFLGTRKVDRNSNNYITSFSDNYMGGVRKPYKTPHEKEVEEGLQEREY